jgi:hypothetical protein
MTSASKPVQNEPPWKDSMSQMLALTPVGVWNVGYPDDPPATPLAQSVPTPDVAEYTPATEMGWGGASSLCASGGVGCRHRSVAKAEP